VALVLSSVGCLGALLLAVFGFLVSLLDYRPGPGFDVPLFSGLIVGGLIGLAGGIVSLWRPRLGGILLLSVGGLGLVLITYPFLNAFTLPYGLSVQGLVLTLLWSVIGFFWPALFVSGGAYGILNWMKHRTLPSA
jgi:hypothetical protein